MNRLSWLALVIWIAVGLYGIFYNITYIDEAKYLIKGWLITTGKIGYYTTPEFFYQHMPGGLLWYGLGQKIFGPNLLIARIQSFGIGLLVMLLSYKLAGLINLKAKKNILPILSLAPVVILYYSSAVPQSLAIATLLAAFYCLFKNKHSWATIWFTLTFIVRENFLFTLIFFLIYQRRIRPIIISGLILAIFFLPGWPGIIQLLKNFPGISWLLPVSQAEKVILGLNFQQEFHSISLYLQAIKEFIEAYWAFILFFLYSFKYRPIRNQHWQFFLFITGFNFFAHAWSAYNLSPRAIVPYFSYIYPMAAVIAAVNFGHRKLKVLMPLIILAIISLPLNALFRWPQSGSTIRLLNQSAGKLKPIVQDKQKIIWIAEPMSLYLAGRISYYPLINHTNFYKPSDDTVAIKKLGFWNLEMLYDWLAQADLVVIDPNRLSLANIDLNPQLNNWQPVAAPAEIWPNNLSLYLPQE